MGFKPDVQVAFVAEARLASWVGISIIGALSVSLNKSPVIEGQTVGVYMSRDEYTKFGSAFPFSEACAGRILTFDSRTNAELRSVVEHTPPPPPAALAELRRATGQGSSASILSEGPGSGDVFQVLGCG